MSSSLQLQFLAILKMNGQSYRNQIALIFRFFCSSLFCCLKSYLALLEAKISLVKVDAKDFFQGSNSGLRFGQEWLPH